MANKFAKVNGMSTVFEAISDTELDTTKIKSGLTNINNNSILFIIVNEDDAAYGYKEGNKYIWMNSELFGGNTGGGSLSSMSYITLAPVLNCGYEELCWFPSAKKISTNRELYEENTGITVGAISDYIRVCITVESEEMAQELINGNFYLRLGYVSRKYSPTHKWIYPYDVLNGNCPECWAPILLTEENTSINGEQIIIELPYNIKEIMTSCLDWYGADDIYDEGTYLENALLNGSFFDDANNDRYYLMNTLFANGGLRLKFKGLDRYYYEALKCGKAISNYELFIKLAPSQGYSFPIRIALFFHPNHTDNTKNNPTQGINKVLVSNVIDATLSFGKNNHNNHEFGVDYRIKEGVKNKY